jgi:hypothetical protein
MGAALAVGTMALAASGVWTTGELVVLMTIGGFAFNIVTTLVRWLLTRTVRRIYLIGRYPFALGLMKLVALIAVAATLLMTLIAAIVEPSSRRWLVDAIVLGFVQFAIIALFSDGLANIVIITRHLRGTLADTSSERRPSRI